MSPEEQELNRRAEMGDGPSTWALAEVTRLVEKNNEMVRECYRLRSSIREVWGSGGEHDESPAAVGDRDPAGQSGDGLEVGVIADVDQGDRGPDVLLLPGQDA